MQLQYKENASGDRGKHIDNAWRVLRAYLRQEHQGGQCDVTDATLANCVAADRHSEQYSAVLLSGMRTIMKMAYEGTAQAGDLQYLSIGTKVVRALGRQVQPAGPKYLTAVDLADTLTQIARSGLVAAMLPDTSAKKHNCHRDAAIFLKRMVVLSRSDDESKWGLWHEDSFRCYDAQGHRIVLESKAAEIAEVIATDGHFEENYYDPKDPGKTGLWSNTVAWRPPARRLLEYVRLVGVRELQIPSTQKGGGWFAVSNAKAHARPDGVKKPLKPGTLSSIVKKMVVAVAQGDASAKVGGHFLRGNGGSITRLLQRQEGASWASDEHLCRARHCEAVFDKSYCRDVPPRIVVAFRNHSDKPSLRFEEALVL